MTRGFRATLEIADCCWNPHFSGTFWLFLPLKSAEREQNVGAECMVSNTPGLIAAYCTVSVTGPSWAFSFMVLRFTVMEKKRTNSGPRMASTRKHRLSPLGAGLQPRALRPLLVAPARMSCPPSTDGLAERAF